MKDFKFYHDAVLYIMANKARSATVRGRSLNYKGVLDSFGYDKSKELGLLGDYKRLSWGK